MTRKKIFNKNILIIALCAFLGLLWAFNGLTVPKASAAVYQSFYGDFVTVEGKTLRDYNITGYYSNSDTIDVSAPVSDDPNVPFMGYYNVSHTDENYTINIYNLCQTETPEARENTTIEINTTSNMRFFITNFNFYSETPADDFVCFIPINKTFNIYTLLAEIYPEQVTNETQGPYPGNAIIFDSNDTIFSLFYTNDMNSKDNDAVFSLKVGFVATYNSFLSVKNNRLEETADGVYYYEILDKSPTYYHNQNTYFKFEKQKNVSGGFVTLDEDITIKNNDLSGGAFDFDYAFISDYFGNGPYNFYFNSTDENIPSSAGTYKIRGNHKINWNLLDFNAIKFNYSYGEIQFLYNDINLNGVQTTLFPITSTNFSNLYAVDYPVGSDNYLYNAFACCFSPYVNDIKVTIKEEEVPSKFTAGKISIITTAVLWVVAFPIMLIGSIINGLVEAFNGGDFINGVAGWSEAVIDTIQDIQNGITEIADDFTEWFDDNIRPLPDQIKNVATSPITWSIVILLALVAIGIYIWQKRKK